MAPTRLTYYALRATVGMGRRRVVVAHSRDYRVETKSHQEPTITHSNCSWCGSPDHEVEACVEHGNLVKQAKLAEQMMAASTDLIKPPSDFREVQVPYVYHTIVLRMSDERRSPPDAGRRTTTVYSTALCICLLVVITPRGHAPTRRLAAT